MRSVLFLFGWCFFGLGAIGVVVPGLPTVPLMLIALWLFSKSLQRFHDWLYGHPTFGPPLQRWRAHGVIPVRAKLVAVVSMTASLVYMTMVASVGPVTTIATALVMIIGAIFILRQPSRAPD